jgi:hypothetical protein
MDRRGFIASLLAAPALAALPKPVGWDIYPSGPITVHVPNEPGTRYSLGNDEVGWTVLRPGETVVMPMSGTGYWLRMDSLHG